MTIEETPPAQSNLPGIGTPAPWFKAKALEGNPQFAFNTAAGRPMLMLFFGSTQDPKSQAALGKVLAARNLFDDHNACFFGVTIDPRDEANGAIRPMLPGIRYFLDYDRAVSAQYGVCSGDAGDIAYKPMFMLLDRQLRVVGRYALDQANAALNGLQAIIAEANADDWAPVLMVPRLFEPELCAALINVYDKNGGSDSGFMREHDGKTVLVVDHQHKRRADCEIEDPELKAAVMARINVRLRPMIKRAFSFDPTRMERYIVACYEAETGGHFSPHRDNTTKGTAHRRFAVTINLNADDYEGGDLRFPEFGKRTYRAPTGGAVVFSCSLLHEATPVTRGKRYAFLPFLYDDEAAHIREANNEFLGDGVAAYQR